MSSKRTLLILIGTRPEAIKLAPVIRALESSTTLRSKVCFVAQHRELLDQMAKTLGLHADLDLDLMRKDQTPPELTARALTAIDQLLRKEPIDGIVAQGDTSTVFAASIAAFLNRCPFFHVEAGLRSGNFEQPWPEEYHRRVAGLAASLHFAPTVGARRNLLREGVAGSAIYTVGNTVIDALKIIRAQVAQNAPLFEQRFEALVNHPFVLITAHRRESFGAPFENLCCGIEALATRFKDHRFVWTVHPNPSVKEPIERRMRSHSNVLLTPPVDYDTLIWLLEHCRIVLTDSGGIQEEAPSFGKPVLVLRETTERPEAVDAGAARLVGTDADRIVQLASELLTDPVAYSHMVLPQNPYGDGNAASRIRSALEQYFC
jgi:UDP-N-acetylglucosamine 2-epimerase (non-hydrolysing)